jgi:hypothetical protein
MKTYNILWARKDGSKNGIAIKGLTKRGAESALNIYRRDNRKGKIKHTFWVVENGK